MIQVIATPGQASCSVRTTGSTWHTSPSAERRSTHRRRGGSVAVGGIAVGTVGSGCPMVNNPT